MEDVFFTDLRSRKGISIPEKLRRLAKRSDMGKAISGGDITVIKLHFGERGTPPS